MLILIRRCLCLSKGFNELIEGEKKIWQTLDLTTIKRPLPKKSLLQWLERSDFTLNKAIIKMFATTRTDPGQTLNIVGSKCKGLEYLAITARYTGALAGASVLVNLPFMTKLKTLILSKSCEVTLKMASNMLTACQTLCTAEFHKTVGEQPQPALWTTKLPCLTHLVLKHFNRRGTESRAPEPTWEDLFFVS